MTRGLLTRNIENNVQMLERHIALLRAVTDNEPIGIIRLAEITNLPEHKVRYSLRILEREGIVEPTARGATSTQKVSEFLAELDRTLSRFKCSVDGLRSCLNRP